MRKFIRVFLTFILLPSVTGAIGGIAGIQYQRHLDKQDRERDAEPALVFEGIDIRNHFVDVFAKSTSSQPFVIHQAFYSIERVVKDAPRKERPRPPIPPDDKSKKEQRRQKREENKRIKQNRKHGNAPVTTGPLQPDEFIIVPPTPIQLKTWIQLEDFDPLRVDAKDTERLQVKIVDPEHAGARYEIRVKCIYGDRQKPKELITDNFQIDVVATEE